MKMETISLILMVLLVVDRIAHVVAAWTATKKDDEVLAKLDKAKAFVIRHSKGFFAIVESLSDLGIIKGGSAKKLGEFQKQLNESYMKVNGEPLPQSAIEEGNAIASGLSAMDKLGKKSLAPQVTASTQAVEVSE